MQLKKKEKEELDEVLNDSDNEEREDKDGDITEEICLNEGE
jgi:hypothetical protein